MKELLDIRRNKNDGPRINSCLSCGTTVNSGRRKYCSPACRGRLLYKLDMRTGLIQALNIRYATFYFSELIIIMDMLPYGTSEIFSFFYPRSPGRVPAEDFSDMADSLGDSWWAEKRRTNKRYLASRFVLDQAVRNAIRDSGVKPLSKHTPSFKGSSLAYLNIKRFELDSPDMGQIIKNAYRRQAKRHHPDLGGDAETFRRIHQAYEELLFWSKNPTFRRRRGFPDKWFYDGAANRWIQPIAF